MGADADEAPGWAAIDQALAPIYGDQEPQHYGTVIGYRLGGPDPLDGISVYRRTEPVPHLHFVTYGFSDLYEKEGGDPEVSGYGFELTFRLAAASTDEVPGWALNFLQNLGRYVFSSGNRFRPGEYMTLNGPIAVGDPTLITDVLFTADPELPTIDTPNGQVVFVQIVGVTEDEAALASRWRTQGVLDALGPYLPLGVTDLRRRSHALDPAVQAVVSTGLARDGSSSGSMFTDRLAWSRKRGWGRTGPLTLTVGARQVPTLRDLLPLRLPFGHDYRMVGHEQAVVFAPGSANAVLEDAGTGVVTLTLAPATLDELLAGLAPRRGRVRLTTMPDLVVDVVPTEITDGDGNVVEVIG